MRPWPSRIRRRHARGTFRAHRQQAAVPDVRARPASGAIYAHLRIAALQGAVRDFRVLLVFEERLLRVSVLRVDYVAHAAVSF